MRPLLLAVPCVALAIGASGCADAAPAWRELPPAPVPRTEVVGAPLARRVAVVGGMTARGRASPRVDLYDPASRRWARLPDLPVGLHHAMAVARAGRLYVIGGYRDAGGTWEPSDRAWVLADRRWRALPRLPEPRAAGGAAIVRNRIYVVGGVTAGRSLATRSLHLDLRTRRWGAFAGLPRPREHLGVTALGRRVYAVGGRTGGLDTNLRAVDAYDPLTRSWARLPDLRFARGGNAATTAGRMVITAGGEEPGGTIRQAEAFDPRTGRWRTLPSSPKPRHGVALVGIGRTVYQALGGPRPGLTVSPTLLALRVPAP